MARTAGDDVGTILYIGMYYEKASFTQVYNRGMLGKKERIKTAVFKMQTNSVINIFEDLLIICK